MYGTLCFLALISNSMVFIYPGQFLPAFGRSQQILDYYPNGLVSSCMYTKQAWQGRPAIITCKPLHDSTMQYMYACGTLQVHTVHASAVRSINQPPEWTEHMRVL